MRRSRCPASARAWRPRARAGIVFYKIKILRLRTSNPGRRTPFTPQSPHARIIDKRQHRRCGSGERPHARPTGGGASMHTVTLSVTARAPAHHSHRVTHTVRAPACRPELPVFIGKVFISIPRTPDRRTLRCNTARGPPPSQWTAIHRGRGEECGAGRGTEKIGDVGYPAHRDRE